MDYSDPIDTECDFPCPATTISPRYLSKHHPPSTPPENSAFDLEERDYGASVNDISERAICRGSVNTRRADGEEGEIQDEGLDEFMPDDLSVGTELDSSELDAFESSFSSLSPRESLEPPETPSHLPISLSRIDLSPKYQGAVQSSPGPSASLPGGSHRSLRPRSASKAIAGSSAAKRTPKDFVKEQNLLLLHWRSQGISYKTIKERLGIDEAESTLRGRLRTLTKPKNERLRRPQWTEKDVCLFSSLLYHVRACVQCSWSRSFY